MTKAMSRKLLLVEDEAIVALNETRILERNGFEVEVVHSGEAAVARIQSGSHLDLVLMDIDLGAGMDGTEAARRILEVHELPIVFLTSHTEPEYVERVKRITGYSYVVKNSGEFVLVQSIEMALKLWEAHRRTTDEKERYRLITENISETVLTVDTQFNVTYVSPSITDLTGFTPAEYMKTGPYDTLTEESARKAIESARRQQEAGEQSPESESHATVLELERRTKSGATVWTETRARPLRDHAGRIIGQVATIRDISERVQQRAALKHSEARYRSVIENTNDALISHDFVGVVSFVNRRACELLGYSEEELVGMHLRDLHAPSAREEIDARSEGRDWSDDIIKETELRSKSGDVIPVEVSSVIASHDGAGEIQTLVRDIRSRKHSERSFRGIYARTDEAIAMWDRKAGCSRLIAPPRMLLPGRRPSSLDGN